MKTTMATMTTTTSKTAAGRAAAPAAPVWVLAADEDVLVRFAGWQDVRDLYRAVDILRDAATVRRLGSFRVLGTCVEVDSPNVLAWRVGGDRASQLNGNVADCGLGDGTLLLTAIAEATPLAQEDALKMAILRVGDDGMLIIDDGDGNEATIDLTELAAVGRRRND